MSEAIISVEHLGKNYRIRHQQQSGMRYMALRDVLADKTKSVGKRLWSLAIGQRSESRGQRSVEDFWALKDVCFEVNQGETLGIIGRNGAGKSTLLKILSRITEPTEGRVRIKGRVASLLEVGTGFHPELTGRENIFLNGAILGMTRAEIRSKFDEIVAFAEVEKFLDTPVKRYSSGMYVRLAFAVAAHLEPEILIVDEVLAVGDAEFQKKCLGKMDSVSRQEGRTVLFVSHNMQAIQQLTHKAVVLQGGQVAFMGPTETSVLSYFNKVRGDRCQVYDVSNSHRRIIGTQAAVLQRLWFAKDKAVFDFNEDIVIRLALKARTDLPTARFSITVYALDNDAVGSTFGQNTIPLLAGENAEVELSLCAPRLSPGMYYLVVAVNRGGWKEPLVLHDVVFEVLHFEVKPPKNADGAPASWPRSWGETVFPEFTAAKLASPTLSHQGLLKT